MGPKIILTLLFFISPVYPLPVCTNGIGTEPDPGDLSSKQSEPVGKVFCFNVIGTTTGKLYGTDYYTDDTALAKAAVHKGLISVGQEKSVQVTLAGPQTSFAPSTSNGMTSSSWGNWDWSYTVDSLCTTPVCISCNAGYHLQAGDCLPCDVTCATCSGPANTQCVTCATGLIRYPDTTCSCNAGYYLVGADCFPCDPTCATCSGSASNQCLTCKTGLTFHADSTCSCNTGFYPQGLNCLPCDATCATCSGPANTQCVTCATGLIRYPDTTCSCNAGHYLVGADCFPCDQTCATCSGSANNQCLTCKTGLTFNADSTCSCNTGYYFQGVSCLPCDSTCETCSGPANNHCLTCKTGLTFYPGSTCSCSIGYYLQALNCLPCDPTCATCSGPATNQCLTCKTGFTLNADSTCSCNTGYYLQGVNCLPCDATCATCSGPANTQCVTCATGLIQYPDTTCSCNAGYYLVAATANCSPCDQTCATCSGPANTQCITCATGLIRYPDTTCSCNAGYYLVGADCFPCDQTCATCSGPANNQCLTCKTGLTFYPGSTCSCSAGYYLQALNCFPCDPTCATCSGPANNQCLTCKTGLTLYADSTCSCNTGYYLQGVNCLPCDQTCSTCSGPANNQCLTCKTGLTLYPNSICACATGYYLQGINCLPCDSTCASCSGPDNNQCLTCNTGRFLYPNSTCLTNCSSVLQSIKNSAPYCEFSCSGSTPYMFSNRICTQCSAPSYVFADGINQVCIYKEEALLTAEMSSIGSQIGSASTVGTFLANPGGSQGISISLLARLLEYIKYINVSHSEALEQALQAQTALFQLSPDIPEDLVEKMPTSKLPEVFSKYDVTSSFIVNFWEKLFIIFVLSGLFMILLTMEWASTQRSKWRIGIRKLKLMARNFLLSTVYNTFGDIIFFSILEFSTAEKVANWAILSFTTAIAFIFICFVLSILHTRLLFKRPTKDRRISQRKRTYLQFFFDDFKEKSVIQRGFLLWMIIRDVIFSIILTVLFEHPLVQASITVLLNITMLILLISTRPFKERLQSIQLILSELDLLVINSSILALAISDRFAPGNIDLIELTGQIIIYLSVAFSLITCIFLLIDLYYSIQELRKRKQLKRKSVINKIPVKIRNISLADTDQSIKLDSSQIISLNQSINDSHGALHDHESISLSVLSPNRRRKINKSAGNLPKLVSNSPINHSNRQDPNQSSRNMNLKSEERYRQKEKGEKRGRIQRRRHPKK